MRSHGRPGGGIRPDHPTPLGLPSRARPRAFDEFSVNADLVKATGVKAN